MCLGRLSIACGRSSAGLSLRESGVCLDGLLDRAARFGKVVRYHDRVNLDACIEREEPRLGDRWDLRSVLHLEKNEPRALAVAVREIRGLWLQVCQNRRSEEHTSELQSHSDLV